MQYFENPGSVQYQVGCSLSAIRECIHNGNHEEMADQISFLGVLAAPYLEKHKKTLSDFEVKTANDENAYFRNCMQVLFELLPLLAKEGLYAKVRQPIANSDELAVQAEAF